MSNHQHRPECMNFMCSTHIIVKEAPCLTLAYRDLVSRCQVNHTVRSIDVETWELDVHQQQILGQSIS